MVAGTAFSLFTMAPGKVKVHELRTKDRKDLLKQLEDLKNELTQLRVAKVTGGAPSKLAKISLEVRVIFQPFEAHILLFALGGIQAQMHL